MLWQPCNSLVNVLSGDILSEPDCRAWSQETKSQSMLPFMRNALLCCSLLVMLYMFRKGKSLTSTIYGRESQTTEYDDGTMMLKTAINRNRDSILYSGGYVNLD